MKRFISIFFSLFVLLTFSQNLSISPYSSLGIGDFKYDNDVVLNSLGGISSAYVDENGGNINFSNPAANENVFFTTFNVSGNSDMYRLNSSVSESKKSNSYVSNLSIGFPISKKIKFGIGFQPFSSTGYEIKSQSAENDINVFNRFYGNGGINSLHTVTSYKINKKWNVGVRLNYLFGTINKEQELVPENADLITNTSKIYDFNGFQITPGFTYTTKINKNNKVTFGGTYGFSTSLKTDFDFLQQTYYYYNQTETNINKIQEYTKSSSTKIPAHYSFGVTYGKSQNWMIGADVQGRQLSKVELPEDNFRYNNQMRFAVGGWIIPNVNSYKSYFSRVIYRFGSYYENTGLVFNNQEINQYGVTFGIGLPVGKSKQNPTMLNIGAEFGQRGTTSNNLIKEEFFKLKIGFNLSDRWFRKTVFD